MRGLLFFDKFLKVTIYIISVFMCVYLFTTGVAITYSDRSEKCQICAVADVTAN